MDINYKQDQFELFPSGAQTPSGSSYQPHLIFSSITLSAENIIILTVLIFLGIIVSFSVGVEKGKRLNLAGVNAPIAPVVVERPKAVTPTLQKGVVREVSSPVAAKQQIVPASAPVAQPATVQPGSEGFYTIQIASFKLRKFAEEEARGLKTKGYETFIVPKGQHLVVCAGRFLDQDAAKNFLGKLKGKYKDCLVRRL